MRILSKTEEFTNMQVNVEDISEHKQAEEKIRYQASLLENVNDSIIAVNINGNVIYWNKGSERMFGWREEEALGKHISFIYPPKLKDIASQKMKEILQKGDLVYESPGIRKDGTIILQNVSVAILKDAKDKPTAFVSISTDITERKQLEEALRKARDELEIQVKQRTKELVKVNEELRIDITERKQVEQKLLNYQAQLRSLASKLSLAEERQRRRIATNLHNHISQELTLSMIKLQTMRESASSVDAQLLDDICDTINRTVENVRSLTFDLNSPTLYNFGLEPAVAELLDDQLRRRHGIACEFSDDRVPKPLNDDVRVVLFQSLRELLINIIKHAQAHKVLVAIQKDGNSIRITVGDDGVGFDADQVESFMYRTGGFGLFNIRERLNYLSGRLKIESEPGRGTQVTLTAPLKLKKETVG